MNARKTRLAGMREEILDHIAVLQRRRGLEATIEPDVLAAILAAKFRALVKDMAWFVCHVLTQEDRTTFRVSVGTEADASHGAKAIREQKRATAKIAKEEADRESKRKQEARNAKRIERDRIQAEKIARRQAKLEARARLQEARMQRKAAEEATLRKPLPANKKEQIQQPSKSVAASKPAKHAKLRVEVKRNNGTDIGAMVQRAVRAIKGAMDITDENVIARAALYRGVPRARLERYVERMPKERRRELGFTDAVDKGQSISQLRPISPNLIARGIY